MINIKVKLRKIVLCAYTKVVSSGVGMSPLGMFVSAELDVVATVSRNYTLRIHSKPMSEYT